MRCSVQHPPGAEARSPHQRVTVTARVLKSHPRMRFTGWSPTPATQQISRSRRVPEDLPAGSGSSLRNRCGCRTGRDDSRSGQRSNLDGRLLFRASTARGVSSWARRRSQSLARWPPATEAGVSRRHRAAACGRGSCVTSGQVPAAAAALVRQAGRCLTKRTRSRPGPS